VTAEPGARKITVVAQEVRSDGGMERAMMETVVGLLELGWQVTLIARVCELDDHPGLHWTRVRTPRRPFTVAFPLFALVVGVLIMVTRRRQGVLIALGAIIPNRVDVVTVQFCHAAFALQGISRPSRNDFIHRIHSQVSHVLSLGLERWCYRPGRLKRMIAVSELIKQELESCYELESVPVDVIPNGVDLHRFRPNAEARVTERRHLGLAPDEPAALFVGGDWQRKGLDIAVEAAARAGWTLIVVGRGDAAIWDAQARKRGVRAIFCGHLAKPELVFAAADAFVLPSRYEGFALVAIEAAASGLPLLVTKATGAATLAERAGMSALPRDVDAFADELRRLGSDFDLRRELGQRARAATEELSWARIVAAYARVYSLAGSAASR
jgi:glycosyltransferase involved in cell wall biosynthesis